MGYIIPSLILSISYIFFPIDGQITVPNFFKPRFIQGTTNGIYLAVAFPIDLPGREAYLGWFFEAIHSLPSNETEYEYPPLYERQLDRKYIYNLIENKIEKKGFPGKSCLLRTICEVGMYSIANSSGIIGDILHLILSPSASKLLDLPLEYFSAELFGKKNAHCEDYLKSCNISLLELVSQLPTFS